MGNENKQLTKWADRAMFSAEPIDVLAGPQVRLLSCNADPLGTIAAAAKMYAGESVTDLSQITDDERRHYLSDVRKNALAAPLEFVNFHFIISGVTRGFTHQMVRQRTATYTQESTRFAVKETVPVGYPPSLGGTMPWADYHEKIIAETGLSWKDAFDFAVEHASSEQLWRRDWDIAVSTIKYGYNQLINSGMPAEDARGLLPTNLLTRINYNSSLRGLLEHSGLRLCTQAQFEWRLVWAKIKEAIVEYGKTQTYVRKQVEDGLPSFNTDVSSMWQFKELATIFKPICYQKGSCQFQSDIDRACTIRDRVQANAKAGRSSTEWGNNSANVVNPLRGETTSIGIPAIHTEEWMLDPSAARVSQ